MADTGNGATFALSVSAVPGCITNITMPTFEVDDIETSCLSTTNFKEYVAADLSEPGQVEIDFLFDATADLVVARGVPEVLTITWPIHTAGNTTNATFIADGYVKSYKIPDFGNGALQTGKIVFKLNGADTEPAFTAEAA